MAQVEDVRVLTMREGTSDKVYLTRIAPAPDRPNRWLAEVRWGRNDGRVLQRKLLESATDYYTAHEAAFQRFHAKRDKGYRVADELVAQCLLARENLDIDCLVR